MKHGKSCFLWWLVLVAGCGYSAGYRAPPSVESVAVPIFQNATFPMRREVEYEVTKALRNEILARTSLRLTDDRDADMAVYGTVREFRENVVTEGAHDKKIESILVIVVGLIVEDYRNARRSQSEVRVREPFSPQLGETSETVRARAIKNLSERMLLNIESWEEG